MEPRAGTTPASSPAKPDSPVPTAGVRIFLSTGTADTTSCQPEMDEPKAEAPAAQPRRIPTSLFVSLVGADFALCVLAWQFASRSSGQLHWLGWTLIGGAILLGAWLSLLAVKLSRDRSA